MGKETVIGISFQYTNKFTYIIAKNSNQGMNVPSFREKIRKDLGTLKGEIVYIYFFVDRKINITQENDIAYIGKSISKEQNTYERFLHEIYEDNTKKDVAKQYTLTHFYMNDIPLKLELFFVDGATNLEKQLLTAHKEMFGYLPIANGKEG